MGEMGEMNEQLKMTHVMKSMNAAFVDIYYGKYQDAITKFRDV